MKVFLCIPRRYHFSPLTHLKTYHHTKHHYYTHNYLTIYKISIFFSLSIYICDIIAFVDSKGTMQMQKRPSTLKLSLLLFGFEWFNINRDFWVIRWHFGRSVNSVIGGWLTSARSTNVNNA